MDQQQEQTEGSPIFLIPDHILEKIFAYSGKLDSLMLTCKYFNDLISNSQKLMMKMPLSIDENSKIHSDEKISVLLNSKKKHYYLTFFGIDDFGQNYSKVLQHFKSSVRYYIHEMPFESFDCV
jgi:hypothetical protein